MNIQKEYANYEDIYLQILQKFFFKIILKTNFLPEFFFGKGLARIDLSTTEATIGITHRVAECYPSYPLGRTVTQLNYLHKV